MEWNLFTYEQILNQPKTEPKRYTDKEYREYIKNHFKPAYSNDVFYSIVMSNYFHSDELTSSVEPKEQLEYFKQLYSNFTYHYQNEDLTIFSLKHEYSNAPEEYSVFIKVHNDFIVELPRVKDLFNELQCMPACAIWFYNADGTRSTNYLTLSEAEKKEWFKFLSESKEIKMPADHSEWLKDRREYYFFYKMKLHKFAKPCRVFEKHTYDTFTDYQFTLKELIYYLTDNEKGLI